MECELGDRRASLLPMNARELPAVARLAAVVARLRAPDGCPWDREQTTASMAPHLLAEAYEALDALRTGDDRNARDELGDVLINVAMIAQIAQERAAFDLDAVATAAADKLVHRHPHVFGDRAAHGSDHAYGGWEASKREERRAQGKATSALSGVPTAMPALLRALRIGEKAARVGFDWPDAIGPRAKIDEELRELDEAVASGDRQAIGSELGDLLFSICNLARHLGQEPETALRGTIDRFQARFAAVEQELGPDLRTRSLDELEASWQQAKKRLRGDAGEPIPGEPPPAG